MLIKLIKFLIFFPLKKNTSTKDKCLFLFKFLTENFKVELGDFKELFIEIGKLNLSDKLTKNKINLSVEVLEVNSEKAEALKIILDPKFDEIKLLNATLEANQNLKDHSIKYISNFSNFDSFSQEGEDILLNEFFNSKKDGFYVEIGALDPFRFSNTYRFYKAGWQGICVDPSDVAEKSFSIYRPKDIFLNCAIGHKSESFTQFCFDEPALNTLNPTRAEELVTTTTYKLIHKKQVQVVPLFEVFEKYLNKRKIDFLSIDVEGFEFPVLESNNWDLYRPEVVLVEDFSFDLLKPEASQIVSYMKSKGYKPFARTVRSLFFKAS